MFSRSRASRFFLNARTSRRFSSIHPTPRNNLDASQDSTPSSQELSFHKQLSSARGRSDSRRIELLWQQVKQTYPRHGRQPSSPESAHASPIKRHTLSTPPLPLDLCNRFLQTLMSVRRPASAISVWNDMIAHNITPSLRSWQALLEGCRHARDPASIEDVFARLLASSTPPDIYCWTTRIHGLIVSGDWQAGVRAFTDMSQLWLAAARAHLDSTSPAHTPTPAVLAKLSDLPPAVKPTTSTVNAAIGPLLKHNNLAAARSVLSLASDLGIPSDIVTYNILLQHDVRRGASQNALPLLADLEARGLTPDIVTFTILLDGLWRHRATDADPAAEAQQTTRLLDLLAHHGLTPTTTTYSTLVTHLLGPDHRNLRLARAVIAHMEARNLPPSPHIPTILLTHMFDAEEPDFEDIQAYTEKLWLDREQSRVLDHIFYERLVRGYARFGLCDRMMGALKRMLREGRGGLSWGGLRDVVDALARQRRIREVEEVVQGVRKGEWSRSGGRGGKAESEFWEIVQGLGIRREE